MSEIFLTSKEDVLQLLSNTIYRIGRVVEFTVDLGDDKESNQLKDFPVTGARWEKLPDNTVLMSGGDNSGKTNQFTIASSNLPTHTHSISDDGAGSTIGLMCINTDYQTTGVISMSSYDTWKSTGSINEWQRTKMTISSHKHGGATGNGGFSNNAIDLSTILKHPSLYIYKRVE